MSTRYHLYRGDDSGGPIDYSTPVGTVTGLTFDTPPLVPGSVVRFGVRAFDDVSGLEETNVDAVVTLTIDAAGADVSGLPSAPTDLQVRQRTGGAVRVSWTYSPMGSGGLPTQFKVWASAGGVVGYDVPPAATVPYSARKLVYSADLSGLSDGETYLIGVRASNDGGDERNTVVVAIAVDADGPDPVDDFAGSVG